MVDTDRAVSKGGGAQQVDLALIVVDFDAGRPEHYNSTCHAGFLECVHSDKPSGDRSH